MSQRISKQKEIALAEAVYFFAPRRLKSWAEEIYQQESPVVRNVYNPKPEIALEQFIDGLNAISKQHLKRSEPRRAMEESLQQKLLAGKLQAFGLRLKPNIGTRNERIPANLFSNIYGIKWHRNLLESSGQKFEAIFVCRVAENSTPIIPILDESQSTVPVVKSSGPKSAKPIIEQLYEKMKENGHFKNCPTKKAIWNKMIPTLSKDTVNFPNGRGLAYSSIARHLKQKMQEQ